MKTQRIILSLLFSMLLCSVTLNATLDTTPSIHGFSGFVMMPGTGTIKPGTFLVGGHFIGKSPSFVVNGGSGLTDCWELTGALEIEDDCVTDPFLDVSSKYRYYNGSAFNSALGASLELAFDADSDNVKFSLYNVIGKYAFGGEFAVGIGYTFDNYSNDYINFWMGYSLEILSKALYLDTDFANFSYRFPWLTSARYIDGNRGIVNVALRLHLADLLILDGGLLDTMDGDPSGYIGGNIKF